MNIIYIPGRQLMKDIYFEELVHVTKKILPMLSNVKVYYICKYPCADFKRHVLIYKFDILFTEVYSKQSPFIFMDEHWRLVIDSFFHFISELIEQGYLRTEYVDESFMNTNIYDLWVKYLL